MVFQFEIMVLDSPRVGHDYDALVNKQWSLSEMKGVIGHWQTYKRDQGFWNTYVRIFWHPRAPHTG